jgi:hypothetical protein
MGKRRQQAADSVDKTPTAAEGILLAHSSYIVSAAVLQVVDKYQLLTQCRTIVAITRCMKGEGKPVVSQRMPGAGLS